MKQIYDGYMNKYKYFVTPVQPAYVIRYLNKLNNCTNFKDKENTANSLIEQFLRRISNSLDSVYKQNVDKFIQERKDNVNGYWLYRFINSTGEIIYIGKTINIKNRMQQHQHYNTKINEAVIIECTKMKNEADMGFGEIYFINKLHPKYNIDCNWEGTIPTVQQYEELQWEDISNYINVKHYNNEKLFFQQNPTTVIMPFKIQDIIIYTDKAITDMFLYYVNYYNLDLIYYEDYQQEQAI